MRKTISAAMTLILVFLFSLAGCAGRTVLPHANLGFDLHTVKAERAVFRVYHSKTETHIWERLAEFSIAPEQGHFADVGVEAAPNLVTITAEDNRMEQSEGALSFYTDVMDAYELAVDTFEGQISSCWTFEIKQTDDEQFYRLYPICNDPGGKLFPNPQLDQPYDEAEENLDNLLITVQFQ